jgi:ABC-type branched-subunit amino acid transport system substrate-binding protein
MLEINSFRAYSQLLYMPMLCLVISSASPSGAAAQDARVKVGVILPMSGPFAHVGTDQHRGMQLALSSSDRIQLIARDDLCYPNAAMSHAAELNEREKVSLLLGAPCAGSSAMVATYAGQIGVPFVATGALPARQQSRTAFYLGVSRAHVAELATELSSQSGVKVSGASSCLWTYRSSVPDGFVAAICPSLGIQRAQWENLRNLSRQKFAAEPTSATAIGFASMQIVLASLPQQADHREHLVDALKTRTFDTILGQVRLGADRGLESILRVLAGSSSTAVDKRRLADQTTQDSCDKCKKSGECPQGRAKALLFSAEGTDCCKKSTGAECPQGSLLMVY